MLSIGIRHRARAGCSSKPVRSDSMVATCVVTCSDTHHRKVSRRAYSVRTSGRRSARLHRPGRALQVLLRVFRGRVSLWDHYDDYAFPPGNARCEGKLTWLDPEWSGGDWHNGHGPDAGCRTFHDPRLPGVVYRLGMSGVRQCMVGISKPSSIPSGLSTTEL